MKSCKFLVWDIPGEEMILGSDILESIGIDPYQALEDLTASNFQKARPQGQKEYTLNDLELEENQS